MSKKETVRLLAWARLVGTAVALFLLAVVVSTAPAAQAQTFQVIHYFSGQADDSTPEAGLTPAGAGKFYGTTNGVEVASNGTVFKLTHGGSGWALSPLNIFHQAGGGARPDSKAVIGPNGNLFGVTYLGGLGDCLGNGSCGVVYEMQPPSHACSSFICYWNQIVLHQFNALPDAGVPEASVIFDHAGNVYGTTSYGGTGICYNDIHLNYGCGTVYELTPSAGGWTETILYSFQGGTDGETPAGGLIFDAAGNLYGTTEDGGAYGYGSIFELSPSNGGWTETIVHSFSYNDGQAPWGSLIADQSGNLYGVAETGGANGSGVAFELSNPGNWTFKLLYNFPYASPPAGTLVFDGSGDLYGATLAGGAFGDGTVFKLTLSGGIWTETDLHDFQTTEGEYPNGGLVFDSAGNLYGTAAYGGEGFNGPCYGLGCGTIWELTP